MRPRSFYARTMATTIAVLVAGQLVALLLMTRFVALPQAEQIAGILAQSVAAVSETAAQLGPEQRALLMRKLDQSAYLDVWPGDQPPELGGRRPRLLENTFMQALVDALEDQTEMVWRTDPERRLWVQVRIGQDLYWLSSNPPRTERLLRALMWSMAAALILSLVAAAALQRRLSRPLEALHAAVSAQHPEGAQAPIDPSAPEELIALTRSFNALTARQAKADRDRALLLAGVSHDVRTPLAKLRLLLELMGNTEDDLKRQADRQVEEIDRILSQFLMFARGFDAESPTRFDLDALVSEVASLREAEGAPFNVQGARAGMIIARPEAIRRALVNLTENAVRHGAPAYAVEIAHTEGHVTVRVHDGGPGVPAHLLDGLRQPFARGGQTGAVPAGAGLGLAIADQVARLHGGDLVLENRPGGGFTAALRLPLKG